MGISISWNGKFGRLYRESGLIETIVGNVNVDQPTLRLQ